MNREEILAMGAGRELDLLVARNILEIKSLYGVEHYSTVIPAAWQVVEKLTESWEKSHKPISIEVIYDCGAYETKIETWNEKKQDWNEPIFSGSCREAPEAISKAALLTKLEEAR